MYNKVIFRSKRGVLLRRRKMLDLLLSLCTADLLVGLITVPADLLLESQFFVNHFYITNFILFIAQGNIYYL